MACLRAPRWPSTTPPSTGSTRSSPRAPPCTTRTGARRYSPTPRAVAVRPPTAPRPSQPPASRRLGGGGPVGWGAGGRGAGARVAGGLGRGRPVGWGAGGRWAVARVAGGLWRGWQVGLLRVAVGLARAGGRLG